MERVRDAPTIGLADRAAARAVRAFAFTPGDDFWAVFPPARREAIRGACALVRDEPPDEALLRLRAEHDAQRRPDLARVHASWWARALRDEPRSVRLALLANLPPDIAGSLAAELGLDLVEIGTEFPATPFALDAALTLWTERLAGDLPERPDDPPVIFAMSRWAPGQVARLLRAAGLAKLAAAPGDAGPTGIEDLAAIDRLRPALAEIDPRAAAVAGRDVRAIEPAGPRGVDRLGMLTFARLLAYPDPHRTRWALQHLPYPTARALRKVMERQPPRTTLLGRWETLFLRAGWLDLLESGRVRDPWTWGDVP